MLHVFSLVYLKWIRSLMGQQLKDNDRNSPPVHIHFVISIFGFWLDNTVKIIIF